MEFLEETKKEYQVMRTFYISMKGHSEMGRRVKQYHFIAWPDHGVPRKYDDFLKFMEQVMDNVNPSDGPTVVHCRYIYIIYLMCMLVIKFLTL